jgi:hypothetical protein
MGAYPKVSGFSYGNIHHPEDLGQQPTRKPFRGVSAVAHHVFNEYISKLQPIKFWKRLSEWASNGRHFVESAHNFFHLKAVEIHFGKDVASEAIHFLEGASIPLEMAKIFDIAKIVEDISDLYKSARKFVVCEGTKQITAAIKAIDHFGNLFYHTASAVDGVVAVEGCLAKLGVKTFSSAAKVLSAVGSVLWYISTIAAVTDIYLNGRAIWRTRQFSTRFFEEVGYRKNGDYTVEDYNRFLQVIENTQTKAFGKAFDIDGDLLKYGIHKMLPALDPAKTTLEDAEKKQLQKAMNTLKGRITSLQIQRVTSIALDVADILTTALLIASVAQPYLFIVVGALYAISSTAQYVVKEANDYTFQNKMKLIDRKGTEWEELSTLAKVGDFVKWYFGYRPLHRVSSSE